jgi:hypothetical protein
MAMLVYQPVSTFGLDSGIWLKIHSSSIIQALFSFRTPLSLVVKTEGFHASCPYLGHAPCLLVHATYFYLVSRLCTWWKTHCKAAYIILHQEFLFPHHFKWEVHSFQCSLEDNPVYPRLEGNNARHPHPPVIKRGKWQWKFPLYYKWRFLIIYKWWIFATHLWLPEGYTIWCQDFALSQRFKCSTRRARMGQSAGTVGTDSS